MRRVGILWILVLWSIPVWADRVEEVARRRLSYEDVKHLLLRAGFGGTAEEILRYVRRPCGEVVDELLRGMRRVPKVSPPAWLDYPMIVQWRKWKARLDTAKTHRQKREIRKEIRRRLRFMSWELKSWWYLEMIYTDSPLTEKMVLFWHNHFTSSLKKVRFPSLMYRQNALFRRYAGGNFGKLLYAISKDPAMVIYLDSVSNRRGKPNENFARELLELFTLGEGHYTEQDIKQAARAFTGYGLNHERKFRFFPRRHDWGEKVFMGQRGYFTGDDIISILLKNPQTSRFIVKKLWREFISPVPDAKEVERLAEIFRRSDYELKPLLRAIFTSPHFWDSKNRGVMIKSPVELLVGTIRVLGYPIRDGRFLPLLGRYLGQDLFDPPNVKGWPGGEAWISTTTFLRRRQVLRRFLSLGELSRGGGRMFAMMGKMMAGMGKLSMVGKVKRRLMAYPELDESFQLEMLESTLLARPMVVPPEGKVGFWKALEAVCLDASYQLK